MRIIVNDIAASCGGAISILQDFYNYIIENDSQNEWIFLLSGKYIDETRNIKVIIREDIKSSWFKRLAFDLFTGKKYVEGLDADAIFYLQNTIIFGLRIPQVLYMDQPVPFQTVKKFSFFKSEERILAIYQYLIGWLMKKSITKADKIIVQTKWIKEAIIQQTKVSDEKVICALPKVRDYSKLKAPNEFRKNQFFYPAGDILYKNHKCIYDACKTLNKEMIHDFSVELTINRTNKQDNIRFLGYISREQVIEKYNSSTLIFPSYIESFGYPLAEARQMGTIILASDSPFSRELLEGYSNAYFFDPFKSEELAILMKKIILGLIVKEKVKEHNNNITNSWETVVNTILEFRKS